MSFILSTNAEGRPRVTLQAEPAYIRSLEAAPSSLESEVAQGIWAVVAFSIWSVHDLEAVQRAISIAKRYDGRVRLGLRPVDYQEEERVAVKSLLRALSPDETAGYVARRLEAAGAKRPLFEPDALLPVHELSGGVPRRINRICDLALLVGFADESEMISAEQVQAVAEELTTVVAD